MSAFEKSDKYALKIDATDSSSKATDSILVYLNSGFVNRVVKQNEEALKVGVANKSSTTPSASPIITPTPSPEESEQSEVIVAIDEDSKMTLTELLLKYWWVGIGLLALILVLLVTLLLVKKNKNLRLSAGNMHNHHLANSIHSASAIAPTKPIDPSEIDKLRASPVNKASEILPHKDMYITIQKPNGPMAEHEITLDKTLLIGKSNKCDIVIDDDKISDEQIQISYKNGYVYVLSLNKDSKSYVNGLELRVEKQLKNKDYINIGSCLIKVNY